MLVYSTHYHSTILLYITIHTINLNEISHGQHRLHPFLYTHFSTYKDNQLYVKTMGSEHTQSVVSLHIEKSCDELRIVYCELLKTSRSPIDSNQAIGSNAMRSEALYYVCRKRAFNHRNQAPFLVFRGEKKRHPPC